MQMAPKLADIFYPATFIVPQVCFTNYRKRKTIVRFGSKLPNKEVMKYILTRAGFIAEAAHENDRRLQTESSHGMGEQHRSN